MKSPVYTPAQLLALGQLTRGPSRLDGRGGYGSGDAYTARKTVTCLRSRGLVGLLPVEGGEAAVLTPRGRKALGIGEVRL